MKHWNNRYFWEFSVVSTQASLESKSGTAWGLLPCTKKKSVLHKFTTTSFINIKFITYTTGHFVRFSNKRYWPQKQEQEVWFHVETYVDTEKILTHAKQHLIILKEKIVANRNNGQQFAPWG